MSVLFGVLLVGFVWGPRQMFVAVGKIPNISENAFPLSSLPGSLIQSCVIIFLSASVLNLLPKAIPML